MSILGQLRDSFRIVSFNTVSLSGTGTRSQRLQTNMAARGLKLPYRSLCCFSAMCFNIFWSCNCRKFFLRSSRDFIKQRPFILVRIMKERKKAREKERGGELLGSSKFINWLTFICLTRLWPRGRTVWVTCIMRSIVKTKNTLEKEKKYLRGKNYFKGY